MDKQHGFCRLGGNEGSKNPKMLWMSNIKAPPDALIMGVSTGKWALKNTDADCGSEKEALMMGDTKSCHDDCGGVCL